MLELCGTGEVVMNHRKHTDSNSGVVNRENTGLRAGSLSSETWNHYHHIGRNSAEDPDIVSTQTDKHVSSNARNHPQAGVQAKPHSTVSSSSWNTGDSGQKTWHGANHIHNDAAKKDLVKSRDLGSSNGKRRWSHERGEEEDVWTEHTSSSGRTYYYNKRLDKSQWERPKGILKKARTDSTHSNMGGAKNISHTPLLSKSSSHKRREGTSSHSQREGRGSGHSRSGKGGSGHREKERGSSKEASGVWDSTKYGSQGDRGKPRESHQLRKSRSHSGSSSPTSKHSSSHFSKISATSHSGSSSGHPSQGHGTHGGGSHGDSVSHGHGSITDKAQKNCRSNSNTLATKTGHPTSSPVSTPKTSGIQLISPTTPNNCMPPSHPPSTPTNMPIPASLSHTLTTTQQLIHHNSILIEQRQKVIAGEATPISNQVPSHCVPVTPSSHHTQPPLTARKLSLHSQQQVSVPSYSSQTPPLQPTMSGVMYTNQGGVTLTGRVPLVSSPSHAQTGVDATGLHPLQRALLLQNQHMLQQQQQTPPYLTAGGVDTSLQTTPTALPHHMTTIQSHPSSPILQSPVSIPHGTGLPGYTPQHAGIQPLTPVQPNLFALPQGVSPNCDLSLSSQFSVLSSKVMGKPVSRLAYLASSPELLQFPDLTGLQQVVGSQVSMQMVDRMLATCWLQHNETISKQVEQCQMEALRRKTVESFFMSGQLTKRRLLLGRGELKATSGNQRLTHLQRLIEEVEKR